MNYIRHLSAFLEKAYTDNRMKPHHVSLYLALFHCWNLNRFQNPVSINREQALTLSKIGSLHTYYRCLKELDEFGYIVYVPSHSPSRGCYVNLCIFDTTTDANMHHDECKNASNNVAPIDANMHLKGCKNDITKDAFLPPSLNYINNKTYREENFPPENSKTQNLETMKSQNSILKIPQKAKRKKAEVVKTEVPLKNENQKKEKEFIRPTLEEAIAFFKEENHPELEAKKFFNHFESNGWKVGGKTPMKNWQAAARNWMLNASRFAQPTKQPNQPNQIKPNGKNYNEPL